MTERRWTIWVCPEHGQRAGPICHEPIEHDGTRRRRTLKRCYQRCERVEVSPVGSPAEGDRELRGAACEALDALEGYLQGESGLPFTEPYGAARKAAGYLRAALGKTDGEGQDAR